MRVSFGSSTLQDAKQRLAADVEELANNPRDGSVHWQRVSTGHGCIYGVCVRRAPRSIVAFVGRLPAGLDGSDPDLWEPLCDDYSYDHDPAEIRVTTRNSYRVFWALWHRALRMARYDFGE